MMIQTIIQSCSTFLRDFFGQRTARRRLKRTLGYKGEKAAERFLKRKRYIIVGRQVRHALGEIDLIAVQGTTIVFVEVKTRQSDKLGHPTEAVDEKKQTRITRAASAYLKRNHLLDYPVRFDVISIVWPKESRKPRIEHFENAFEATGKFQLYG